MSPESWFLVLLCPQEHFNPPCLVLSMETRLGQVATLVMATEAIPSHLPLLLLKCWRLLRDRGRAPDSSSCPKEASASELSPRRASCSCGFSCPVCFSGGPCLVSCPCVSWEARMPSPLANGTFMPRVAPSGRGGVSCVPASCVHIWFSVLVKCDY